MRSGLDGKAGKKKKTSTFLSKLTWRCDGKEIVVQDYVMICACIVGLIARMPLENGNDAGRVKPGKELRARGVMVAQVGLTVRFRCCLVALCLAQFQSLTALLQIFSVAQKIATDGGSL